MDAMKYPGFKRAFAADPDLTFKIDADETAMVLSASLGVEVPAKLVDFWGDVGGGYFGNRTLYVFGGETESRDSVLEWNARDYWARLFPPARAGGPVFFAETCFGLQIGFRWENDAAVGCILDVDTLTMYSVEGRFDRMLDREFSERQSFYDPDLLDDVLRRLGPQKPGMHYAPIVTPLVGGLLSAENYQLEAPQSHLRRTIATWETLSDLRRMNAAS